MTDSTEEDMTMFRWRSTLSQWDIISGNTRNWRRESRKQKKNRWNRSKRCSDYLSADKIFLRYGQVLFKCAWNMKRLFTTALWITFLGGNIQKRAVTLKVVVNTIYSLQPLFFTIELTFSIWCSAYQKMHVISQYLHCWHFSFQNRF